MVHEKIHHELESILRCKNKKAVTAAKESIRALYDLHVKKTGKTQNIKEKSALKTCH